MIVDAVIAKLISGCERIKEIGTMGREFNYLLYKSVDENISVNALIKDETIWLTQKAMAELFGVQTPAISKHLKNIFEEGELEEEVVISKMEIPTPHGAIEGKTQLSPTQFYNLDAIISDGYRVNSLKATNYGYIRRM